MKFIKVVKAEEKFNDEWFDGHLQSLINWAEHVIELKKEGKISLENKQKIQSFVLDFMSKIRNEGK